ncbi:MAG: hypothetical protein WCS31_00190 [Verrucomicrobiae bacterium]
MTGARGTNGWPKASDAWASGWACSSALPLGRKVVPADFHANEIAACTALG